MKEYNLKRTKRGDTWKGLQVTIPNKNLTGAQIHCDFRRGSPIGTIEKTVELGTGITITDVVNGVFTLDAFDVDFKAGEIHYAVKVIIGSVKKTYVGGTWPILP